MLSDAAVRKSLEVILEWACTHAGNGWKWGDMVLKALRIAIARFGVCECDPPFYVCGPHPGLSYCPLCGRRVEVPNADE